MESTKRARLEEEEEAQSLKEEKVPKLKCHEMRLIFQRLPTSELIRFISKLPKHPLGQFWSQELNFVVEKRLPFAIRATAISTGGGTPSDHVIYDCNSNRVAEIARPKQFRLSPICELIERAEVPAISPNVSSLPPRFVFPTPDILSALSNLDTLSLSVHFMKCPAMPGAVGLSSAFSDEVMSRINSLSLPNLYRYERLEKPLTEVLSRAINLKKLYMPYAEQNALTLFAALPSVRVDYSGLELLSVKLLDAHSVQSLLEIITTRFDGLRELLLPVRAPIRQYLAAFRVLPHLATLGLDLHGFGIHEEPEKHLAVGENDAQVVSVTELIIACELLEGKALRASLAMLSMFPNVRTFGADFGCRMSCPKCDQHAASLLHFASAVCAGGVFRQLQALKLFSASGNASLPGDALLQFIRANIDHLPNSFDLSQVKTAIPRNLDRYFLVDLCTVLQGSRVASLALKDLVHRDAVLRLREHFALDPTVTRGKVLAWIDEESIADRSSQSQEPWWPGTAADFTDFRIEACKTSGPLKGSAITVRISNWTEKRKRLFDDRPS